MTKIEFIKELKNNIYDINSLRANLYHDKVFAVVGFNGLQATYKTKRGAQGYIKRRSNISYYDEMTFEMVNAGSGLHIIELFENEIPVIDMKTVYNFVRQNMHTIQNYNYGGVVLTTLETAVKGVQDSEKILAIAKTLIDEITSTGAMTKPLELYTMEELTECIEYMTNNYTLDYKERLEQARVQLEHIQAQGEQAPEETNPTVEQVDQQEEAKNLAVKVEFNDIKKGIELYFKGKPSDEIRENLKANGFRWARFNKCWYCKDSEEKREFLSKIGWLEFDTEKNSVEVIEIKNNISHVVNTSCITKGT